MPSPGMDSPYILRLLFPDRNADRNARAFPGPGVFRSTTSGVAVSPGVNHLWGHWHLGGRWRSTTSEVAVSPARPVAGTNHQILIYIFFGMC